MSLFDEWASMDTSNRQSDFNRPQGDVHPYSSPSPANTGDDSKFQIEQQDIEISSAVCFATAMNIILIGTSNNDLLRLNIETGRLEQILASTKPGEILFQVFLSPDGNHSIIAMTNGVSYYMSSSSSKLAQLQKIKNQVTQSVAWFTYDNEPNAQHALIGTTNGAIFDLSIEDGREKACKQLFQLKDSVGMASGLDPQNVIWGIRLMRGNMDPSLREAEVNLSKLPVQQWHLVFVTSLHKYSLQGGPTLEALFAKYNNNLPFIELPGSLQSSREVASSQLTFYVPPPSSSDAGRARGLSRSIIIPSSLAWLTTSGVFMGDINPTTALIEHERILDLPKIVDQDAYNRKTASGEGIGLKLPYLKPLSILLTEFHLIVLFRELLCIINTLNDQIVMQTSIPKADFGPVRSLAVDESNNTYWVLTDQRLLEIVCLNEEADIWKIFFERNNFEMALMYCQTNEERKLVIDKEAHYLFSIGKYVDAARRFHKANAPFEVIAMKYLTEYARYSSSATPLLQEMVKATTDQSMNSMSMLTSSTAATLQSMVNSSSLLTNSSRQLIGSHATNALQNVAGSADLSSMYTGISSPAGAHFGSGGLGLTDNRSYLNNSSVSYANSIFKLIEYRYEIYNGLKYYLELHLQTLHGDERTQLTLLSDWIVELYINTLVAFDTPLSFSIDKSVVSPASEHEMDTTSQDPQMKQQYTELLAIEQRRKELYEQECERALEFIQNYHDCLHPATTYSLLASSGRTQEYIFYAELSGAHNLVVDLHLRNRQYLLALEALCKLRKPTQDGGAAQARKSSANTLRFSQTPAQRYTFTGDVDLVYRTLPTLIMNVPHPTVDFLIETDGLSCARVLTSLVRSGFNIDFDTPDRAVVPQQQHDHKSSNNQRGGAALNQSLSKLGVGESLTKTIQRTVGAPDSSVPTAGKPQASLLDFEEPEHIVNISAEQQHILHTTRYLEFIIVNDLAPIAAHNLYIALLIQLRDNDTLLDYLKTHRHSNFPNRVFALRLCSQQNEVMYPSTIELCLQLQRYVQAIRYALRYDIDLAKEILADTSRSLSASKMTLDLDLWSEYVNVLRSKGKSIIEIVSDIRSWNNNVTLLDILPCLPDVTQMSHLSHNVTEQLIDFNTQLSTLNTKMNQLRQENETLKQEMTAIQHSTHLVTPTHLCDICAQPVLLSSMFYFQCTHAYHAQCCVNYAFEFLRKNPKRKKDIFLQKLADFADGASVNVNNVDVHESAIQYLSDRVAADQLTVEEELALVEEYSQSSCPFCGEIMIESSDQDYITSEDYQTLSHEWAI